MGGDLSDGYLDGLPPVQAAELARVNEPGLRALREYLASGQAVAFLGAGVSAPLYPLWNALLPDYITTTEKLGRAMIAIARHGAPKRILENRDINAIA